jgi:uncharacterized membrane protein
MKKILLVGESWTSQSTHFKGFDAFQSVYYELGATSFVDSLKDNFDINYMPSHIASTDFPSTISELEKYDCIIISDCGANTLLLHPDVFLKGKTFPNRLKLIEEFVNKGGSFVMFGGYLSFQGINGSARYKNTPIERILPVNILPYDDRIEVPEGCEPFVKSDHTILDDINGKWPNLLGINQVETKQDNKIKTILTTNIDGNEYPLLVISERNLGKTAVWTSDVGPHWLPNDFVEWKGYKTLWTNFFNWLTN